MVARARPESGLAGLKDGDAQAVASELPRGVEPAIAASDDGNVDLARELIVRRLQGRGIPPIGLRLPVRMERSLGHDRSGCGWFRRVVGAAGARSARAAAPRAIHSGAPGIALPAEPELSSKGRPTSCTASGKPVPSSSTGTVIAGWPVTLNMFACVGQVEGGAAVENGGGGVSDTAVRSASNWSSTAWTASVRLRRKRCASM